MSEDTKAPETTPDPIDAKFKELGVPDEVVAKLKEGGVESVEDLANITEADLIEAGLKKFQARKVAAALKAPAPADTAGHAAATTLNVSFDSVLPTVMSDTSWLEALKLGGVLKVDQSTVISAVRAALAHKVGLFNIPDILGKKMEEFADENEEQVDPEFYKIRRQLTRRSYAEIFEAIDGMDGTFVTEGRKKQLLSRIDERLWPAILEFFQQLDAWVQAWQQGTFNPTMLLNALAANSARGGTVMPPGMMQPPETGGLRDCADAVSDAINRVFAGTGVQIAAAMAYDASRIKETLQNPRLPALVGAANREQMLKLLGVGVSATYPRLENNITQFVLATMQVKDQSAGNEELQYFSMLHVLGRQITWDQISGRSLTGIGGKRV